MATVVVLAHNNRIEDAETTTGWGNIGGGGGVAVEPDIVYQGSGAASRKVSTSLIGRDFLDGTTHDFTAARRKHWIAKVNATNYSALQARSTPTMNLRIGNSSTIYEEYYIFGNDPSDGGYPISGGWQILAIDPSVVGYQDASPGTTTLTAIDYFGILADFSATAKAENLVIDAIDCGSGLHLTKGDGGSTPGTYQDFIDYDEGTVGKRFGYVTTKEGILYVTGGLFVGQSGDETTNAAPTSEITSFEDVTGKTIVLLNSYASTGFFRHVWDIATTGSVVTLGGHTYLSRGRANNDFERRYVTTEDTRGVWEVIGTAGTLTATGIRLVNFASMTLTSGCTITDSDIQVDSLTQGSANLSNSVLRVTAPGNTAMIDAPTFGTTTDLHDVEFVDGGPGWVRMQGNGSNQSISTPDHADFDITGDIDLRCWVELDKYGSPGFDNDLISKWELTGDQRSYVMLVDDPTGALQLAWSTDGTAANQTVASSTVDPDASMKGLRATLDVSTGDVNFYYTTDNTGFGGTWTQLGSTVTGSATSIHSGTEEVRIGAREGGTNAELLGKVYRAEIRDGIGGTVRGNPDFTRMGGTTYTDDQSKVWTVNNNARIVSNGHAIELDTAGSYTLTNVTFTGFGANDTTNSAIWCSATTGDYTINWSGGNAPTIRSSTSGTVSVVNSVAVTVNVKDIVDQAAVSGAFVHVEADSGGPLAHDKTPITAPTRSGSTVSVGFSTAHGLTTGQLVRIAGATEPEYNGTYTCTVVNSTSFTYQVSGTPTSPATNSSQWKVTGVIIHEDSAVTTGIADNPSFPFVSNQPITGVVRQGDVAPYYQQGLVSGSITANGFETTIFLVRDS